MVSACREGPCREEACHEGASPAGACGLGTCTGGPRGLGMALLGLHRYAYCSYTFWSVRGGMACVDLVMGVLGLGLTGLVGMGGVAKDSLGTGDSRRAIGDGGFGRRAGGARMPWGTRP